MVNSPEPIRVALSKKVNINMIIPYVSGCKTHMEFDMSVYESRTMQTQEAVEHGSFMKLHTETRSIEELGDKNNIDICYYRKPIVFIPLNMLSRLVSPDSSNTPGIMMLVQNGRQFNRHATLFSKDEYPITMRMTLLK